MHYIGCELQDRMSLLGIDIFTLSAMTFMDENVLKEILDNKLAYEDIDEFDLSLICSALHCDSQYFVDSKAKSRDLLISTMNRGKDSVKSKTVKAKIQDFMNDYAFINDILLEEV
jgi:hypothetical protein